jgi:hypothetical protein
VLLLLLFAFVLLPSEPVMLLPEFWPLLPDAPVPVPLDAPALPEVPVPPFPELPDDWARAEVAKPSEITDTVKIFVNMSFPHLSSSVNLTYVDRRSSMAPSNTIDRVRKTERTRGADVNGAIIFWRWV